MKIRASKFLSVVLCLVLCAQFFFAAGLFAVQINAASLGLPSKLSGISNLRSSALMHGNYATCFNGVNATEASTYASNMISSGYTQTKTGSLGSTTYWHYTHPNGAAYLVFDSAKSTLYVVTDDRSVTSPYVAPAGYTKITDTTLGIMSLDYSHGELGDGNGICNIWTLEDGSYLVIDGGYVYDSQRLYNYLYDNNKRPDGQIVIHAWYFTHGHGDHYDAFKQFTADHNTDVTLQYVIASAAAESDPLNANLLTNLAKYNGAKLVRPHTGETYNMPGLKIDILYTCEDLYVHNGTIDAGNNSSTVSRFTVGGQTILYSGDAESNACDKMISMYGSALKSDFLQINHHGYSGGTAAFYNQVKPSYILWTSSQFATEQRTSGKMYQWIGGSTWVSANRTAFSYVDYDYDKVFAADGPVELMTFPYNGDREALPTYRAHDTRNDPDVAYVENFNNLTPGTYTADQICTMLGWTASGTTGVTFTVTADKKLRITSAPQKPGVSFDFSTGKGTPSMNFDGDLALVMEKLDHFTDGRTVIEYELCYHESIIPAEFGAAFRVRNDNISGSYWYEPTFNANGTFNNRYRYNTTWNWLSERPVANADIPYNNLTKNYATDPENKWLYDGYIVTDQFTNWTDSDGDGTYTSNMTHQNDTIFGSVDRYKIVIDPKNGTDVYVNGVNVTSSRVDEAWRNEIFHNLIGSTFGMRVMPGVDVTIDDVKVYREDNRPELLITEIAPKGDGSAHPVTGATGWNEYIEVYNNSDARINIYDYSIVKDNAINTTATLTAATILQILPGTTTWVATNNAANTVTHTNPSREGGWLEPGESALLWIPTNTMYNTASVKAGLSHTLAEFRASYGLADSQKAFVAYNNGAMSLNNSGYMMYAVGRASMNYVGLKDVSYGNYVSYVYHNSAAGTAFTGFAASGTGFQQTFPMTHCSGNGSIRYYYPENNEVRRGYLYLAETDVRTPGVIEDAQKRDRNLTVLYSQNFDGLTAQSHTFSDADASSYYNYTFKWEKMLGWDQMTPTDGSEIEITSDGKLRIYNPYYMPFERSGVSSTTTKNYDLQIEIGDFAEMIGNKVILEYDFKYNDRGTEATAAAVFSFGRHVDPKSYCFAPAMSVQGFYQARVGTAFGGTELHQQIRPEWIPYTVKNTGYNYPHGGVTNHYNIYGGTNHVKIEVDPYNGITVSVNGVAISMVQNTETWESLYQSYMGEILGLSVAPGVEVILDNIELRAEREFAPELIITEVGNAMGTYEYIEVYNNSTEDVDIYDYKLMRNTNLASGGTTPEYTGVGTKNGTPIRWTNSNIATILKGTHTYTAQTSGQSVTLTNPDSGIIKPGQTAILWIPSNTTMDDTTSAPTTETLEMFMNNYGLTDASKIYAAYNNNNISLWDGSDIAYGLGYADVDYTAHNAYALNELVSYVYMNTAATTVYGNDEAVTKPVAAMASVEYDYAHNNGVKRGIFLKSVTAENTIGRSLPEQRRTVTVNVGGKDYELELGSAPMDAFKNMSLHTVTGTSVRTNTPTGMRWMTAVNAEDYATVKEWLNAGLIEKLEIGTIVIRTADLGDADLTLDRVNNVDCFNILATPDLWFEQNPTVEAGYGASLVGTHIFAGSVANIKKENYNAKYSGVGYMSITLADGTVETIYGGYSEEAHSRSVAEVAYLALQDPDNGLTQAELDVIAGFAACYGS